MRNEIIYMSVDDITPYGKNPRKNEKAVVAVANSINEFGFRSPIIVDKDMVIINGHTRLLAAKHLGLTEVPVIVASDLNEEQVRAFRLADNKVAEIAEWDDDLLQEELDLIEELDMTQFGFQEIEIETEEPEEDDFNVDDVIPEEPKAKPGDIYQLGVHRLMCGDSTSEESVKLLLGNQKIDMIFTDPPYGMNLDTDFSGMKNHLDFAKEKHFSGGKKYDAGVVDDFKPEMIDLILKLDIEETFLWGADYFAELLPNKNDGSWIVWDKRANGNDDIEQDYSSDKMYGSCFELCWSKKKHKRDIARVKWAGVFGTEQEFDHKRHHPTQKPIKLCSWFIERYSDKNQTILDLFGGSGSTLIACEQLKRKCYMMELDPKYVDVIIARWEQYTGKKAELVKE